MEDLEGAISLHREALTLRPLGHPERLMSLNNLASALFTRFNQSGKMDDLDDSISAHRQALSLLPLDHPDRAMSLNSLANALYNRFERSGSIHDLEDAISIHREALTLRPLGHPYHSSSLNNLAIALYPRFNQSGGTEDLEEEISSHRESLTLHPRGHPNRSSSLNNLANSLHTRFNQSGRMEDLEEEVLILREILALYPRGHPDLSMSLNNLATALSTRFEHSGKMGDLEDAISTHREALTLRPLGHPDRSMSLNNLASALSTRFEKSGKIEDLEEEISSYREALALRPLGHPGRSASLNNLAKSLYTRFKQSGMIGDLEDAISIHREALTLRPLGHPYHSSSLNNLAANLITRFERSGRIEDLEDAISIHREALTLRPLGHPDRSMSLNNLAFSLYTRFEQSGVMGDLEDAISIHHEALTLRPLGHPDRPMSLNNLAIALSTRFEQSGGMEDLEDAIASHHEVLTLWPRGHPGRFVSLHNLANALSTRFEQSGQIEDLEESFTLYKQAANDLTFSSLARLDVAMKWVANAQLYNHQSTISAYSTLLHLLDYCLHLYPNIDLQHKFLATIPRSLASDAASAAIDAGDLMAAVELLEQGRTILWSRMAKYRHPLDQLRKVNTDLADCFQALTVQLEHLSLSSGSGPLDRKGYKVSANLEVQMQQNRILLENLQEVLGKIQKIEGFGNFLQAVPFATLQLAAAEGPVILINISKYRSDAIVLHTNNHPILVTLSNVQPENLIHLAEQLALIQDISAGTDQSKYISPILHDLWNNIVSPVVNHLTEMGVPEKSHIWWCPTSELCGLPLHAAGPYRSGQRNLPDIYISSYTPTLSALIKARLGSNTGMLDQSAVPKLLVIGQPGKSLPNVQEEIDNIQQLGDFVDVIVGTEAKHDKVLHSLQQHSWAHFACHGHLGDNAQPFNASFELYGGSKLTLLDLMQARLPNAELAFLSACHSAEGDLITPDETIHLAAALQFCGFRSVVGTLWAIDDRDGPTISKEFYKHMFCKSENKADFRDSAKALNLAIRALRKNHVPLERWISFVHIGA